MYARGFLAVSIMDTGSVTFVPGPDVGSASRGTKQGHTKFQGAGLSLARASVFFALPRGFYGVFS